MAYIGILPEAPSFGQLLGRGIGSGINKGLSSSAEFAQKMALKKSAQDPYKQAQQARLSADSLFKHYSTRIKEMQNYLSSGMYGKGEAETIRSTIKQLQSERDTLFGWSQKVDGEKEERPKETPKKSKKQKFDPNNKEHKSKAQQLYQTFNDKEKVRKELSKEFEF